MGERKFVVGAAVRQDIRALAAELGVGRLVDAQLAAGCTGISLSVLEQRRERDVAAARRAAVVYANTVGRRMPGLKIAWPAPRVARSSTAMPPLTLPWPAPRVQAGAAGGHAPMPPLRFSAR